MDSKIRFTITIQKKHGEVDFVIEKNGEAIPIEVKSRKPNEMNIYNRTALNNILRLYRIPKAIVLGETNVIIDERIV